MAKMFDVLFTETNYCYTRVSAESKEEAIKRVLLGWCNNNLEYEIDSNVFENVDSVYDNDSDKKVFEWGDSLDDGGVVVENGELFKWENGRSVSLGISAYCPIVDAVGRID